MRNLIGLPAPLSINAVSGGKHKMVEVESWESKCCRCEGDPQVDVHPGKRACHITCGPCLYPADWSKCVSCEIVEHCMYAISYLRSQKPNGIKKGCIFKDQLNGEETLYHTLNFVNAQQSLINTLGEKKYLEELRRTNVGSSCLGK